MLYCPLIGFFLLAISLFTHSQMIQIHWNSGSLQKTVRMITLNRNLKNPKPGHLAGNALIGTGHSKGTLYDIGSVLPATFLFQSIKYTIQKYSKSNNGVL